VPILNIATTFNRKGTTMDSRKHKPLLILFDLGSIRSLTHGQLFGFVTENAFPPFDRRFL
jgi:hypothetical protein